jgi:DNA-directed RNA polymerase subunit RPC12/RpoP
VKVLYEIVECIGCGKLIGSEKNDDYVFCNDCEKHEMIYDKLADIRNLFDEADMDAEGHGMDDAIGSPYAVACYAENKLKRQQKEIDFLKLQIKQAYDFVYRPDMCIDTIRGYLYSMVVEISKKEI